MLSAAADSFATKVCLPMAGSFLQSLNGLKRMLSTSHYPVINPSVNNMHTKELFVAGKRDGFLIVGIMKDSILSRNLSRRM